MTVTFKDLGNQGRLGNQLWQLSCTIALALDHNDSYIFPPWQYERYFNLHNCFSNNIPIKETYLEPHFHYALIPYKSNLNLSGYFQSYLYFQNHESTIRNLLTPNYDIEFKPGVSSIHVRRTDYLKFSDCHPVLDMTYYNKAMELCPSDKYYIFSDDMAWCQEHFKGSKFEFIQNQHETLDIFLMARCENNIIANSSFSWWGAYLNNNPNKKIIAPQQWFGPKLSHNIKDLLPPTWIKI